MTSHVQLLLPNMPQPQQRTTGADNKKRPQQKHFWKDLTSGKFAGYIRECAPGERVANAEETYHVLKPMFVPQDDVEQFFCIFLNIQNRIIEIERLFSGSISSTAIYPREVVKRSLALKAAAVVFGHNHPSGNTMPSLEDLWITKRLFTALKSCGITVHDHIVVGEGYYSMSENGFIQKIESDYKNYEKHRQ